MSRAISIAASAIGAQHDRLEGWKANRDGEVETMMHTWTGSRPLLSSMRRGSRCASDSSGDVRFGTVSVGAENRLKLGYLHFIRFEMTYRYGYMSLEDSYAPIGEYVPHKYPSYASMCSLH